MDFMNSINIAAGALSAQRTRMNVISSNIANTETTQSDGGGPYKRKDILFKTVPVEGENSFTSIMGHKSMTVKVDDIIEDQKPPKRTYKPLHPDADDEGYVSLPNINVVEEMVNLISSSRSYNANTQTIKNMKQMANTALSIAS